MNKDPENCPYCQAEEKGFSDGWGISEEGWKELEEIHYREHCDKYPCCGHKKEEN